MQAPPRSAILRAGALSLLAILAAACDPPRSERPTPSQRLTLTEQTASTIAGRYQGPKHVLQFRVHVRDVGEVSVSLKRGDGTALLRQEIAGGEVMMDVLGRFQVRYDLRADLAQRSFSSADFQTRGDARAFEDLGRTEELRLLPGLAGALDKRGIRANTSTAAAAIHQLATTALEMVRADRAGQGAVETATHAYKIGNCYFPDEDPTCEPGYSYDYDACECKNNDPPPEDGYVYTPPQTAPARYGPNRNFTEPACVGMCGRNCDDCWESVCGDCNYHFGCAVHDNACGTCNRSWGLRVDACVICYTPLAAFVAKIGC